MLKNVIRGLAAAAALVAAPAFGQVAAQPDGGNLPGNPDVFVQEQQEAPLVVCFAEGTDEKYVAEVTAYVNAYNEQFGDRYYLGTRWSGTAGTPRAVTWSFVPDGLSISGGAGEPTSASNLFAKMDTKFARATWVGYFQNCFDRWQQLSGLTFTRITVGGNDWDDGAAWSQAGSATRGDIRISMHSIDGASNILAYTYYPSNGNMVMDADDINNFGSATNSGRFLRNTVMHELGHAYGIDHVCSSNSNQLMEPFLSTSFDGPRHDDFRAVQRYYGDVVGTIGTAATAKDLGTLVSGTPINVGTPVPAPLTGTNDTQVSVASLDDDAEVDWYKFTTTASLTFGATLTPYGKSYDDSSQAASGACNSGTTTNSLAILNMRIDVYASDGTTLLGSASSAAAGAVETISGLGLGVGSYYVKVSAAAGTSATQLYQLSLTGTGCAGPSITGQPSNLTRCTGTSATFTVTATGATGYQWRKNTTNIGGATSSSYTIPSVAAGDAGSYDCVVSNACSSVTSNAASLTVNTTANITGHPSNQTKCVGQSASFSVTATGATGYQWRKNTTNIGGATSSTYTIPSVVSGDAASYDCVVSNGCGNVTSNAASLTVNSGANISGQPADQSVCEGQPASFSVTATGATGYQWRKDLINIGGATGSSYTIASVSAGDAGSYDCVVSSDCGDTISNSADLSVGNTPNITGQPVGGSVCRGGSITLSVTATGASGYQWRKDLVDISGANGSTYAINPATVDDAGSYDCVVSGGCADVTSDSASVVVCVGDFNCDSFVNGLDYDEFADLFESGDLGADINGDGFVNGLDYDQFAEAFEAGC
ncbi:MAG: immunoglobulin domain-containing protein [Phycisphaerales bacterium]|nr:immunoglobulin domain-containing protein [Phycisphaerales bacterium]